MAATSTEPVKVLVCGDVAGKHHAFAKKVGRLNAKFGPFECVLCVGSFFAPLSGDSDGDVEMAEPEIMEYISGKAKISVPTYILGSNDTGSVYISGGGGEVCENVTYLGRAGVLSLACGIRVTYLSGVYSEEHVNTEPEEGYCSYYTVADVAKLMSGQAGTAAGVDILLTNEWPESLLRHTTADKKPTSPPAHPSPFLDDVAVAVAPRYHFAGYENVAYERPPYKNWKAPYVTRFRALAAVGNESKAKFVYALNLKPSSVMDARELSAIPPGATTCPYYERLPTVQKKESFFFGAVNPHESVTKKRRHNGPRDPGGERVPGRRAPLPPQEDLAPASGPGARFGDRGVKRKRVDPGPCWFCLASPQVEKHLIASIGTEVYIALAKGGLDADHVLILPIAHEESLPLLDESTREEIDKYKAGYRAYCKSKGKEALFTERRIISKSPMHMHIQAIGMPPGAGEAIQDAIHRRAEKINARFDTLLEGADLVDKLGDGPYCYFELDDGTTLVHKILDRRFPMQFGREVAAEVLGAEDLADWRKCKQSKEKETEWAGAMKAAFAPFAPRDDEE